MGAYDRETMVYDTVFWDECVIGASVSEPVSSHLNMNFVSVCYEHSALP